MARHRTANEKKALDHFLSHVQDFSWNKGTFAALLSYEHPVLQQKVMDTLMEIIDSLASNYIHGAFDARNADACEMAYTIKMALEDDERFRIGETPVSINVLD